MPRVARQYLRTSFFHVMVQGLNKEFIFKKDKYINRYLYLIQKNLDRDIIKIIAFCIMNNHAHLLMQVEEVKELSKYMQKVNSVYAKYYNHMEDKRVGYVFRDRYKMQPILDKMQLVQCVKYIHQNPVKAKMVDKMSEYKYSSYQSYQNGEIRKNKIFTEDEIIFICREEILSEEAFLDIDIDVEKRMDYHISEFIKKERIKVFEIFEKDDILKKLIKYLKESQNIKYTDIMKRLDITKGTMERLKR